MAATGRVHDVGADGYCHTCGTVPCMQRSRANSPMRDQLDRMERNQHKMMRALGVEVPGDEEVGGGGGG